MMSGSPQASDTKPILLYYIRAYPTKIQQKNNFVNMNYNSLQKSVFVSHILKFNRTK